MISLVGYYNFTSVWPHFVDIYMLHDLVFAAHILFDDAMKDEMEGRRCNDFVRDLVGVINTAAR